MIARLVVDGSAANDLLSPVERHRIAVGLVVFSGVTMAGMMTTLKLASGVMSLWQVMVLRAGIGALLLLPVFRLAGINLLPSGQYALYIWRIFLAAGGISCWIYSVAYLPLGVATAISFSKGLFVLWLAAILLGERITSVKVATTLAGFVGVLLVLDPTGGGSIVAGLAGVLGALFGALLSVVIKRLSATEPTIRMMFYPLAGISVIYAVPAALTWQPLDMTAALLTASMVVLGMISQWCFISAYRLGEVSALAPVEYSRLVMAVIAGFLVFSEVPTLLSIAGMALIAGASYAAFRFGASEPAGET
ncbi:MAG: DMT family transporter [Pseudomonadota bacterium]